MGRAVKVRGNMSCRDHRMVEFRKEGGGQKVGSQPWILGEQVLASSRTKLEYFCGISGVHESWFIFKDHILQDQEWSKKKQRWQASVDEQGAHNWTQR